MCGESARILRSSYTYDGEKAGRDSTTRYGTCGSLHAEYVASYVGWRIGLRRILRARQNEKKTGQPVPPYNYYPTHKITWMFAQDA